MEMKQISDESFQNYGKIIDGYNLDAIMKKSETFVVTKEVIYEPSIKELEELELCKEIGNGFFGEMPIQVGYCMGYNKQLNAVEYHRSSEINIAITDLIVMVGRKQNIVNYKYDTSLVEAFFVPAKTMFEFYATTLHYAPCDSNETTGFKSIVILPKGTNTKFNHEKKKVSKEDSCLFAKNKWLIAHEEANIQDAYVGLVGENICL